jgi:RNA polymerase sigma-70 factor (ECF subfamily)
MAGRAAVGKVADEEARLARAAAAGDGSAFATLYERYERRVYNLAYRITGSEPDAADATREAFLRAMRLPKLQGREPAFDFDLFTATRNACYDLMEKRPPAQASDAGLLPLEPRQKEVRDANMRLPGHQREALALRELEELSYDEIAAIMEMTHDSVAQLIYRARINLRDEMGGTVLATVAAPSPECGRALPLIAAREDGQLEAGSDDDAWLNAHLAGCERCRLGVEVMEEAAVSYRAWAPIAVVPWLLEETMSKAAAPADADWSDAIAEAIASRADSRSRPGTAPAHLTGRDGEGRSSRRRRAIAVAGLAAMLIGSGIAAVLAGSGPVPIADQPAADTHSAGSASASKPSSKSQKKKRGSRKAPRMESESQATTVASSLPTEAGESAPPAQSPNFQGESGLQPPQAIVIPKPKPTRNPPSQPASSPAPAAAAQPSTEPPAEDPSQEHPSKGRGPPAGVPPTR